MSNVLVCPVCAKKLNKSGKSLICENNHSFDFAKEGYVNLLLGSKSGDKRGDSRESAAARREFLNGGYYFPLKDAISKRMKGRVLDICCGEGYYDDYSGELYGFDISKEMVRLAAKRNNGGNYFVANMARIPVSDGSFDTAIHLFAPFNDKEFSRVIKDDGTLYSVIPGENHLIELKNILYKTPYKNDEKAPESPLFNLISKTRVKNTIKTDKKGAISLFSMTPYFYRTKEEDKEKLNDITTIDITVDFIILEYKKAQ